MDKVKQGNFLALCLLDALEDGNERISLEFIINHKTNPNHIVYDRGIAAIHYACGMENVDLANKVMKHMLEFGGDPNLETRDDKMTPVHISAMYGRLDIFNMLLEKGGDVNKADGLNRLPIHYAIYEEQFEIVERIQRHIKAASLAKKPDRPIDQAPSPYYINVTTRRKKPTILNERYSNNLSVLNTPQTPDRQNIFSLTRENLSKLSQNISPEKSTKTIIESWREKVQKSRNRKSIIAAYENVDSLLSAYMSNELLDFTNTDLNDNSEEEAQDLNVAISRTAFCKMMDSIRSAHSIEDSFVTANEKNEEDNNHDTLDGSFLRAPGKDQCIVQISEAYVHTDTEEGLIFYERRLISNPPSKELQNNILNETQSTNLDIPLDYDTDALRAELTQFGEAVGPITKSTKKLYLKRLIKYKKNPEKMAQIRTAQQENSSSSPSYSIELERTLKDPEWFQKISDSIPFETEMVTYFQNTNAKKLREGHQKQSFIYLLIDPRVSQNLPGESMFISKHDAWKRFVPSIFYVGKGKSARPYAHLYEALKTFNRKSAPPEDNKHKYSSKIKSPREQKLHSKTPSKKLERILDIWKHGKGVVCLHVFHNILAAEAMTREAAIIEALGLKHLTNMKVGDFYGPAKTWPMRRKKNVGTLILFKALQVYLAEGESQLSPSDLL